MKALRTIGIKKAIYFLIWPFVYGVFKSLPYPPLRSLFLKLFGAKIGKNTVIHSVNFVNFYRGSFKNIHIGDNCFAGNEVLFDLAGPIHLKANVTVAERCSILTHLNVGYADHPLQASFPAFVAPVTIESGAFIGVNSVILAGTTIGEHSFIGACSLVNKNIPAGTFAAGVPAKSLKKV